MDTPFDPAAHDMIPPRPFADFHVGETFNLPSRTITEAMFAMFQALSGDNHPIHYDREYCKRLGHPDMLAHGYLVLLQTVIGAGTLPHLMGPALIGFIEQSSRFLKGVFPGDTLYPSLVIADLKTQRTTGVMTLAVAVRNQHGDKVLEGEHKYLLKLTAG